MFLLFEIFTSADTLFPFLSTLPSSPHKHSQAWIRFTATVKVRDDRQIHLLFMSLHARHLHCWSGLNKRQVSTSCLLKLMFSWLEMNCPVMRIYLYSRSRVGLRFQDSMISWAEVPLKHLLKSASVNPTSAKENFLFLLSCTSSLPFCVASQEALCRSRICQQQSPERKAL